MSILCNTYGLGSYTYVYLARFSTEGTRSGPFLLKAEIGSKAGVTSHLPKPLSIDTAVKVPTDVFELCNALGLELHYLIYSLRPET